MTQRENKSGGNGSSTKTAGVAELHSYVDRVHHAVIARGQVGALFEQGYLEHARALGTLPDELAQDLMRKALTAAVLRLALLPPDQFCSWTYNLIEPALNIFVTGDNSDHEVTGRVYTDNVKTVDVNRLFIEMARPELEPARSVVDFEGTDIIGALHEYYRRGLQMRARIFELSNDDAVLIEGLPMVDQGWLEALDDEAVAALFEGDNLEKIEKRTYRFHCGCDAQRIAAVMRSLFSANLDELFQGDDEVEAQCPRCGRHWTLARADFDVPEA